MGITRLNNGLDHGWVFDPSTAGTSLPQCMPTTAITANLSGTTQFAYNTYPYTQTFQNGLYGAPSVGRGNDVYFAYSREAITAQGANGYLYFGAPSDAVYPQIAGTYNTGARFTPVILKRAGQSITATFQYRLPPVSATATTDCPVIAFGLNGYGGQNSTPTTIARRVLPNTTHGSGFFQFADANISGTTATNATWAAPAATEYPCSIRLDANGNLTYTIFGFTQTATQTVLARGSDTNGQFFVAIGHGGTGGTNMGGLRNLRIWIGT